MPGTEDMALAFAVSRFYYREARLLDERCYTQWLALLDPAILYHMPSRQVAQPDPALKGTEDFLSLRHDVGGADAASSPLRFEMFRQLAARAMRPFKVNAWAESPPPRTRRLVSNIEILDQTDDVQAVVDWFLAEDVFISRRCFDHQISVRIGG